MIVRISTEHIDEEPSLLRKSTRCSLNMSISWMKTSSLGSIIFCRESLQMIKNQKLKIDVLESTCVHVIQFCTCPGRKVK